MSEKTSSKIYKILDVLSSSKVEEGNITTTCDQSFLNYSLSVITSRALPDLRDGLKPVHRRILYAAYEEKLFNESRFKKSATLVGAVMGSYHPHGDKSIYDALVRLSQDFKMRYPLLEGQGNFGSIDGDAPAAMRYTEIKMSKLGQKFLEGIKEECVDFVDNYDGSKKEPAVLPVIAPSILLNGGEGIAVGMATKIPSHNLKEVCEAAIALIDDRELDDERLIDYIKGPDFATGCEILGIEGIKKYQKDGVGRIRLRARVELIQEKSQLIIKEIPFGIIKSKLIKKIAKLSTVEKNSTERKNVVLQRFVLNIRDESNLKEGIRLIIQCREGADLNAVLNNLYKYTDLQTQYTFNLTLLNKGKPERFGIGEILRNYLDHQIDVLKKKTVFNLGKVEERIHLLEGRWAAVNDLQEVIRIITEEDSPELAMKDYFNNPDRLERIELSDKQIEDIFSLPLRQLKKIERNKLKTELDEKRVKRGEYQDLLEDENKQRENIKGELRSLIEEFKDDERRTRINEEELGKFDISDLVPKETVVIKSTEKNFISAILIDKFKLSKTGGVGKDTTKNELRKWGPDVDFLVSSSRDDLLMFTNLGRVFSLKTYSIKVSHNDKWPKLPEKLNNLLKFREGEKVIKIISIPKEEFSKDIYLFFATKFGMVKRVSLVQFKRIQKNGKKAIGLKGNDELKCVIRVQEDSDVILTSSANKTIRFAVASVRAMGRGAKGVIGINLKNRENKVIYELISASSTYEGSTLLAITDKGRGKVTNVDKYLRKQKTGGKGPQRRGGKGLDTIKCKEDEKLMACTVVNWKNEGEIEEEILLMTDKYHIIRFKTKDIAKREKNRKTQANKLIDLDGKDKLIFFTKYQLPKEML